MDQLVKVLTIKPEDLSSTPGTHVVEGENSHTMYPLVANKYMNNSNKNYMRGRTEVSDPFQE